MIRNTALAVLALAALSMGGGGGHITLVRPTTFLDDILLAPHSSADGPLRNVTICFRYQHVRSIDCESLDAAPSVVDVSFQPGFLELRQGGDVLTTIPFPPHQETFNLTEFDGNLDMDGTSGFQWRSVQSGTDVIVIEDPRIMSRFVDVRNAVLTAEGFDLFSASGNGNLQAISRSEVSVFAEVLYDSSL